MTAEGKSNFWKIVLVLVSFFYLVLVFYIVFLARRRQQFVDPSLAINWLPIKGLIDNYRNLNPAYPRAEYHFYANLLGNVLLFVPFSVILLRFYRIKSRIMILLAAVLFSMSIEATQYSFRLGVADIDDVLLNFLGAIVGMVFYCFLKRIKQKIKPARENSFQ
jgi:glycopeptide antibiotics resistance protein